MYARSYIEKWYKVWGQASLDYNFGGGNGYVTSNFPAGGSDDQGSGIIIDGSGNIYVTGFSTDASGNGEMAIWSYTSSGGVNTLFGGGNGYVLKSATAGGHDDAGKGIVISTGNIIVTGSSFDASGNLEMAIWEYTLTGGVTTFGGSGYVLKANTAGRKCGAGGCVTITASGNIVVTGSSVDTNAHNEMSIWEYTSTGSKNSLFGGGNGYVLKGNTLGGNNDSGNGVVVDGSGNIVVAGTSYDPSGCFYSTVWRYYADWRR